MRECAPRFFPADQQMMTFRHIARHAILAIIPAGEMIREPAISYFPLDLRLPDNGGRLFKDLYVHFIPPYFALSHAYFAMTNVRMNKLLITTVFCVGSGFDARPFPAKSTAGRDGTPPLQSETVLLFMV